MPDDDLALARRDFQRILLIKLSAVGDVIHTIALANALRRRYPSARIDWLLKPSVATLIRPHPAITNVLVYGENHTEAPRYNWDGVMHFVGLIRDARFVAMLRKLRAARYDLVIDVHGQLRTGFVSRLTGAGVRIGFDKPRPEVWEPAGRSLPPGTIGRAWKGAREGSWKAYTHHIRLETLDLHAIERYLRVGRLLGFDEGRVEFVWPIPADADRRVDALLSANGIAMDAAPALMFPGALWETKRWRPASFAEVARHIMADGRRVIIAGSADEQALCRAVSDAAPGAVDLSGKTTLLELAALVRRARLCVTNDSGPMHMAVALGRPVVSIFGPTHPGWVGPYKQESGVVRAGLPCSPCYLRNEERCPNDHACMRGISAATVIERIETILARPAGVAIHSS